MKCLSLRYWLGLLLCGVCFTSRAQRSYEAPFYYSADGRIQPGSVTIDFKFYQDDKYLTFPEIINYGEYNYESLQLRASVSEVKWNSKKHEGLYKLAFADEHNVPGEAITKASTNNTYLRSSSDPKELHYRLSDISEPVYTTITLGFFVLGNSATYADLDDNELSEGKVLGFGRHIEPLMLLPRGYQEAEGVEAGTAWRSHNRRIGEFNSTMEGLSYEMALLIREEDYAGFEKRLEEKSFPAADPGSREETLPAEIGREPEVDYDRNAFREARRANTISAYQGYLREYPQGAYAGDARDRIAELTPFDIHMEEGTEGVFKVYTLSFLEGVGARRPKLALSNNEDWAIKKKWAGRKKLEVRVPPGRSTTLTLSLGRKKTALALGQGPVAEPADNPAFRSAPEEAAAAPQHNDVVAAKTLEKPGEKAGGKKALWALILALPYLAAIIYLLYKKHLRESLN